jgi:hypothetical protein
LSGGRLAGFSEQEPAWEPARSVIVEGPEDSRRVLPDSGGRDRSGHPQRNQNTSGPQHDTCCCELYRPTMKPW